MQGCGAAVLHQHVRRRQLHDLFERGPFHCSGAAAALLPLPEGSEGEVHLCGRMGRGVDADAAFAVNAHDEQRAKWLRNMYGVSQLRENRQPARHAHRCRVARLRPPCDHHPGVLFGTVLQASPPGQVQ